MKARYIGKQKGVSLEAGAICDIYFYPITGEYKDYYIFLNYNCKKSEHYEISGSLYYDSIEDIDDDWEPIR